MGENACDEVFDLAAREPGRVTFGRKAVCGWLPVTAKEFADRVTSVAAGPDRLRDSAPLTGWA
jgi:hypothetical protein